MLPFASKSLQFPAVPHTVQQLDVLGGQVGVHREIIPNGYHHQVRITPWILPLQPQSGLAIRGLVVGKGMGINRCHCLTGGEMLTWASIESLSAKS
jgi:hypothetical protein